MGLSTHSDRAMGRGYRFDERRAKHAAAFIERYCRHSIGAWRGRRFELLGWQRELVHNLFGWIGPDGYRRYRAASIWVPKKNGKSTIAAAIELYLLVADNEGGAQVYCAASDRLQASIVWREAAAMVQASPELSAVCRINRSTRTITCPSTDGFLRAISADAHRQEGLNISGLVFDELHAQKNRNLWDALRYGSVSRRQPMCVVISTAGTDRTSVAWDEYQRARDVADGRVDDDRTLPAVWAAEESDCWAFESTWIKANPSLDAANAGAGTLRIDELREAYTDATTSAASENAFRQYRLNQWVAGTTAYLPSGDWDATEEIVPEEQLARCPCYGGLDLAVKHDLTSLCLLWALPGRSYYARWWCWLPRRTADLDEARYAIPFTDWSRGGYIELTPGAVTPFEDVREAVSDLARRYGMYRVAYDPYAGTESAHILEGAGLELVAVRQNCHDLHESTELLAGLISDHRFTHEANPVAQWCASNLLVKRNVAGQLQPTKGSEHARIDCMVSAIMALKIAALEAGDGNVLVTAGMQTW